LKILRIDNLTEAFDLLCERLRTHPHLVKRAGGGFNFRGDYYIHLYDLFLKSRSCRAPGLFLEDLGYSVKGSKITSLLSKYIDIETTEKWLDFIKDGTGETPDVPGDAILNTKTQIKRLMPGACITAFLYRGVPRPSLTVISRSVEMPTKGGADVLLISAVAQLLCNRIGLEDIPIRWFITSIFTRTRTASYYTIYKWPKKVVWTNKDFQAYVDRSWRKYYLTDYEFSYSANKRAKQFFLNKKAGKLTHLMDDKLFYKKLEGYLK